MRKMTTENADGRLLTVPQIAQEANLGRNTARKIASEAGAVIKIGRSVRVDRAKFFDFINQNYTGNH